MAKKVSIHGVQPEELGIFFPLAATWIYKIPGMSKKYKLRDVYTEIKLGNWQLWVFMDDTVQGVLLSTIVQFPLCRELHLLGIAGRRMAEWKEASPRAIEYYARMCDCDRIVVIGARKGFKKVFPDYCGERVVLEKKL